MARFSIGTAFGDAFGLVRDRPLAVLVWGLLLFAPLFCAVVVLFPAMGDVIAAMPAPGEGDPSDSAPDWVLARMIQFQLGSMLFNIANLLVAVVVYTAVFRAVIRPTETEAFSLRLGMDEVRIAVVGLAIGVGLYAAMLVFAMIAVAIGFAVGQGGGTGPLIATILILIVALVVMIFVGLARVSMIAPASLLYRDFAFVQGWRLASGNTLPLLGMMLLVYLSILLIELVLIAGVGMALVGQGGLAAFDWIEADANPFAGLGDWLSANWHWTVVIGLVGVVLYGLLTTLAIAPFASACRQLAEGSAPTGASDRSPAPAA